MASIQLARRQNPFLRSNPFYRPQKFNSEPKVHIISQLDQFEYNIPFSSKNMSQSRIKNHLQSSSSLNSVYSQSKSRGQLSENIQGYHKHSQKDSKLAKHSMKLRENPFLRKHLVTTCKENVLPPEKPIPPAKLEDKHRKLFGSLPKGSQNLNNLDQYIVNFKCSPQVSPKKISRIAKNSFEGETDRSYKSPDAAKNKYQSSELQIKLKSQTFIEPEQIITVGVGLGIPFGAGTTSGRGRVVRESFGDDPQVLKVRGKNFYLAKIGLDY